MNLVDEKWNHGSTLAEIENTIREGVPNTLMQGQKENFTTEQIADLAKYVKLLSKKFHAQAPQTSRESATKLTDRVAAHLPSGPKVEVGDGGNLIDRYIFGKMKADGIPHSGLCTDAEFFRRVHLDLWGRLPDSEPGKNSVIDQPTVDVPRITVQEFVAD